MSQFRQWLNQPLSVGFAPSNALDQYHIDMEHHGYDDVDYLASLAEEELEAMFVTVGITKVGHKDRLLKKITKARTDAARADALLTPSVPVAPVLPDPPHVQQADTTAPVPRASFPTAPWRDKVIGPMIGIGQQIGTVIGVEPGTSNPCGGQGIGIASEAWGEERKAPELDRATNNASKTGISSRFVTSSPFVRPLRNVGPITFSTKGKKVIVTIPTKGISLQKESQRTLDYLGNFKGGNNVLARTLEALEFPEFDNLFVSLCVLAHNPSDTEPSILPTTGPVDLGEAHEKGMRAIKYSVSGDLVITLEIDSGAPMTQDDTHMKNQIVKTLRGGKSLPNSNLLLFICVYRIISPSTSRAAHEAQGPKITPHDNYFKLQYGFTFHTIGQKVVVTIPTKGVTLQKNEVGNSNGALVVIPEAYIFPEFDNLFVRLHIKAQSPSDTKPSVLPTAGPLNLGSNYEKGMRAIKYSVSGDLVIALEIDSGAPMTRDELDGKMRLVKTPSGGTLLPKSNLVLTLRAYRLIPRSVRKGVDDKDKV